MAKNDFRLSLKQYREMAEEVSRGIFKNIYVLMGEDPYYPEKLCKLIQDNVLQEWERDFNETVCFGSEVDADYVVTAARRFPMMAERQLVMVKDAQAMRSVEDIALYCQKPLDSTVLVLLFRGVSLDKRKSLYKAASKAGAVFESVPVRDYEMPGWIREYYSGRGLDIDPEAAALLAEYSGTDLSKLELETEKLLRNLPEGTVRISVGDIEKNVDISRQFSVFELTRQLSCRDVRKAVRTAGFIGRAAKFALPMTISALFSHFYRVLKYGSFLKSNPGAGTDARAKLLGIQPYFLKEYDEAVRFYPIPKCMKVLSLLEEYDFKSKGGDAGEAPVDELFTELILKILTV